MEIRIREAKATDVKEILKLVKELAIFENAPFEVINTEEKMLNDGFSSNPLYGCYIAEYNNIIAGFALYYYRYSTWKGKCLYLEDLFVKAELRRLGIGNKLFENVIKKAKDENCFRLNWQVLDWNTNAQKFYDKFNAKYDKDWWNGYIEII
ncbi:MAG: GNAT family N-acetyltransferase [Bacteroidetes bacterium]|nr:GNAT family N-acetyltransferase [Bacteroidota bacterium]